jgi:hypothetical protein
MLATAQSVTCVSSDDGLTIVLPSAAPDAIASVVKIVVNGSVAASRPSEQLKK